MDAVKRVSQLGLHSWDVLCVCAMQREIDRYKDMQAGSKRYGGKGGISRDV